MTIDRAKSRFIAVRNRAYSPSVFFGPFNRLEDVFKFSEDHDVAVAIHELIDPAESSPEDWWD